MASEREVIFRLKAVADQGNKGQFDAVQREAVAAYEAIEKAHQRARQSLGQPLVPAGGGFGGGGSPTGGGGFGAGNDPVERAKRHAEAIRGTQDAVVRGYSDINRGIGTTTKGIEMMARSMVLFGVASETSIERAAKKLAAFEGAVAAVRGGSALLSGAGAVGAAAGGVSLSGVGAAVAGIAVSGGAAVLLSEQLRGTAQEAKSWTTALGGVFARLAAWADKFFTGQDQGSDLDRRIAGVTGAQAQRWQERDLRAGLAGQLESNRVRFLGEQGNIFALSRARQSAENRLADPSLSGQERQAAEKALLAVIEAQRDALQKTAEMARQGAQERATEAKSRLQSLQQERALQQQIADAARAAYTGSKERFGQMTAEEQAATVQAVQRSRQGLNVSSEDARRLRTLGTAEGVEAASRRDIAAAERAGFDRLGLGARELAQEQSARQQVQQLTLNVQSQNQLIVKLETDAANFAHSVGKEIEKVVRDIYEQTREDILRQIQNVPAAARAALAAPANRAA